MQGIVERTTRLPHPAAAVYAWHARAGALERLTPPWERVDLVERSGGLEDGARVVLRVHVGPAAFRWVAVHRDVVPGQQFVDEQVEGPFSRWVHTHRMVPDGEACLLTDQIEYAPPYGLAGGAADLWLIRGRLEQMLAYRHAVLRDDLAAHARFGSTPPLHVALTGASGLVGRSLTTMLTTGGHRVSSIVRRSPKAGEIEWDPARGALDARALENVDAVVHLAGENIAGRRWTADRRRRIRGSRARGTALLAEALGRMQRPPRVLVSASAVGYYGNRGDEVLTERSGRGSAGDFLVQVTLDWEHATAPARSAGIRVAIPRLGVVLSPAGGALAKLLLPFRVGLGGPLGGGAQWMSWISIDDAVGAIHHALLSDRLEGPFNATAPEPVTNADFAATLGHVLARPALLPVPAVALRALFGEMASATVLASQRALPAVLGQTGYPFRHASLEPALRHLLGRRADSVLPLAP